MRMNTMKINDMEIEVIKKNIKNIRLSVHPPYGRVRLAVPIRMNDEEIKDFLISKLAWIEKQKSRFKIQEAPIPDEFLSGENHCFFGNEYILNVLETTGKQHVKVYNNENINLYIRPNSTKEKREKLIIEWYREELKKVIPRYIEKWEPIIGVKVEDWGVKLMKTRWGTCNTQAKRIWINLELAKKNPRCLEYLIVHEMVHLLERKHNDNFRSYMDNFLPNWREIQAELNSYINY